MHAAAKTGATAAAVAKVQAAARKAGHACNEHDARFIGYALEEAITRRRYVKDVKVEYGALRVRFDLKEDGELEMVDTKGDGVERKGDGLPAGDGQASQRAPPLPPGLDPSHAPQHGDRPREAPPDELARLRERAAKATEAKKRQKAARKAREETKREHASKYALLPYGSDGAAIIDANCPLWSTRMDLKMAFTKVVAEVTQRSSLAARAGVSRTRGVSARFGGSAYQMSVLDGTLATGMTADELSADLLVLLADGLTEERLVSLLKRWSKATRKPKDGSPGMDTLD